MTIATTLLNAAGTQKSAEIENWIVIVMGVGLVFIGLICIIVLCKICGLLTGMVSNETKADVVPTASVASTPAPAVQNTVIENRQEIIAAVTAACAEEMGKDVSAIRVISFKKL